MRHLLILLLIFCFASCSQLTQKETSIEDSDISEAAKLKLQEARDLIRNNQFKPSIVKLAELGDEKLSPLEKALKYNLKGVAHFSLGEVDKSLSNFVIADKYSPKDTQLYSQVQLNMASAHFKLNQFNELKTRLGMIDPKALSEVEQKKFAQLNHAYGIKFENHPLIVSSSVILLSDLKTFAEITSSNLYEPMKASFKKLSQNEKIALLEEFNESNNLAVAQLAQLEAEDRYINGDKSGAQDVVAWLKGEFPENEEVNRFIKDFELRLENSSRISIESIGVVLPMTGTKATFGQKALSGIDTGLKLLALNERVKVHTKDVADSPAQGAQAVLELIRGEKVAFIIGGLFPENAKAEYLEARKYGVLYISLSQINLPKEDKNHHLIEVQGSIESQIETLLSDEMIKKFGPRVGVIYPENEGGKAYMDEIWRLSAEKNLQVTSIASFPRNTHDYRDTAQLFLGLKHPRERSEELKILEDVYAHEKTSIRRVQTLPPVLDFDWVFMASYPQETAQLVPTLGYYDATRIKVIGGPSWGSKSMVKEQKHLGTLYFVGDDPQDINQDMLVKFQEIYGKPAGLIEIMALDAMKLGAEALQASGPVSGRDEFDTKIKEKGELKGLAAAWVYKDGVWLKRMNTMTITRGEIVKLFGPDASH
ncbi:MAG TPA: ABC transporter substrate-binding protein [Bacteriovoracaceae bacterium]|nr:ABC transporter substrate-binding protein [Bacteriovoracaceae bacterium]